MKMYLKIMIKWVLMNCSSWVLYNHKSKILYYHDIYKTVNYKASDADVYMGTHLDMFIKHVEMIKREGYSIVPQITEPDGQICIMLDDGFKGIYECRQFFYDNQIFPTVFLAVDLIGKKGFLNVEEILDLQNHGFIFECHTWSHSDLTKWNDVELKRELGDSKAYLSKILQKEITEICLPIGCFNNYLIEQLKLYRYTQVYSSIPGNYKDKTIGGMIARNLAQYATPEEVKLILRGGNELIKSRYQRLHYQR